MKLFIYRIRKKYSLAKNVHNITNYFIWEELIVMKDFIPDAIYYEEKAKEYELGKELLEKYKDVPQFVIENHNILDVEGR